MISNNREVYDRFQTVLKKQRELRDLGSKIEELSSMYRMMNSQLSLVPNGGSDDYALRLKRELAQCKMDLIKQELAKTKKEYDYANEVIQSFAKV